MTFYHAKIRKIKECGSIDFIKINYMKKTVILKLVDVSDETIHLLTEWRKKYRHMFATNFKMSEERTKKWVSESILKNPDRILFMIYLDNKKIGCIGTAIYDETTNSANLDTMMKDPTCNYHGLMTVVEKVYLRWIFDGLKLSKIRGFLFSDNYKMMNVHVKCGWVTINSIPLKRVFTEDGWRWESKELKSEDEFGERYFNVIELTRENLMKHFDKIDFNILICE